MKKKDESMNLKLAFKKNNFKYIEVIYKSVKITNIRALNKIFKNEIYQKERINKVKFINNKLLFYYLILLILISNIFRTNCQNSIVTLKVSQSGQQNIFHSGTRPNQVFIDDKLEQKVNNSYSLNSTNIVKLIWTDNINDCYFMFYGCKSILEMNFIDFDAQNVQAHLECLGIVHH